MTIPQSRGPTSLLPCLMTIVMPAIASLAGCAGTRGAAPSAYDLGSLRPIAVNAASVGGAGASWPAPIRSDDPIIAAIAPLSVADVVSAPWLDSRLMYFRLDYQNDQQLRPYSESRWSMPPPQLLGQRIKARLAQSGVAVVSPGDGAINLPVLRIEADDFSQRFSSPTQSDVHVALRASLFTGRLLMAQKSFDRVSPALSPDAAGGARALASAADVLIVEMTAWIAAQRLKR